MNSTLISCGKPRKVDVDIILPVYNEQAELASSVALLARQLGELHPADGRVSWHIVIADNANTDST